MKFIDSIREWPAEELASFVSGVAINTTDSYLTEITNYLDGVIAKLDVGQNSMLLSMVNQYIKEVQKSVPVAVTECGNQFADLLETDCGDVMEKYAHLFRGIEQ